MKKIILSAFIFISISATHAEVLERSCSDQIPSIEFAHIGQFTVTFRRNSGGCLIQIKAPDRQTAEHSTSRSFTANSFGGFSVFSDFFNPAGETNSLTTGMKSYMLLPTIDDPKFYSNSDTNEMYLQLASGEKVFFNTQTGMVDSEKTTDITINETPEILYNNDGGITVAKRQGIQIDAGFRLGNDPLVPRNRAITVRDTLGHSCRLTNRALFDTYRKVDGNYILDNRCSESSVDQVRPKATGSAYASIIRAASSSCRSLDLSSLENPNSVRQLFSQIEVVNTLNPVAPPSSDSQINVRDEVRDSGTSGSEPQIRLRINNSHTLDK